MDPVRNPYAPGAGQRPPELAGREQELHSFDVTLERVGRARPERSVVLTGLRGVGKTVLLNALRSSAVRRGWGTGKLEIRPGPLAAHNPWRPPCIRRSVSWARPTASRTTCSGSSSRSRRPIPRRSAVRGRDAPPAGSRTPWQPGINVAAVRGRADSGDIEIDLVELLVDLAGLAADTGKGIAVFMDELQDLDPGRRVGLCAACHELGQRGLPLVVVGAGLPHLPAVLSASKSYSERLFHYTRIGRLRPRRRRCGAAAAGPR